MTSKAELSDAVPATPTRRKPVTGLEASLLGRVRDSVDRFVEWLESYGDLSQDHQDFYASKLGGKAKELYYKRPALGLMAVAPMVFCEAFLPSARRFFHRPQRLPISDAHFAMGYLFRWQAKREPRELERAVHYLGVLKETACPGYEDYCWGYPFDWTTRNGIIAAGTPLITTTPYAFEAFQQAYSVDDNRERREEWLGIVRSTARHAASVIRDFPYSKTASTCSYTPFDRGGVVNASAYRASMLTMAARLLNEGRYWEIAERNLNFVLETQNEDGSWPYAVDGERDFVDHFHTCFVMKALAKIEEATGHKGCHTALERGVSYYLAHLFDEAGLPRPFSVAPRLTLYKAELYDYAECLNLCLLLHRRFPELRQTMLRVLEDLVTRWQKPEGGFRSRRLLLGWDNVPMHRWGQSEVFRSLAMALSEEMQPPVKTVPTRSTQQP